MKINIKFDLLSISGGAAAGAATLAREKLFINEL